MSDREKECSVVGGQCVAGAIGKVVAKKIRERDAKFNEEWEDWKQAVMTKYWMAWGSESCPISNDVGVAAVAAFLDRAGRFVANSSTTADVEEHKNQVRSQVASNDGARMDGHHARSRLRAKTRKLNLGSPTWMPSRQWSLTRRAGQWSV